MPELNVDLSYWEWPEVLRLVGLLGRGTADLPLRMKAYCGRVHPEDGRLVGYSAREVETTFQWWGKPGDATAALVAVGFLVPLAGPQGGYQVMERKDVSWLEGQGHIAAYKVRGSAAAQARWKKVKDEAVKLSAYAASNATSNAQSNTKHCSDGRTDGLTPLKDAGTGGKIDPDKTATAPGSLPPGFVRWYSVYPRRENQADAVAAWRELSPDPAQIEVLVKAAKTQAASQRWTDHVKNGTKHLIPMPANWLRGKRWTDDLGPAAALPASTVPRCSRCVATELPDPKVRLCAECAWCVDCDMAGRVSRKRPAELLPHPQYDGGMICRPCEAARTPAPTEVAHAP